MMAAAEVRAAWQRSANRCIVQEDAKRAPKFTCCPSSSAPQNDSGDVNVAGGKDNQANNFTPLNWNPLNPKLSPNTKWWLQQQPKFGYQKDYIYDQLSSLDEEIDDEVEPSNVTCESLQFGSLDFSHEEELFLESPWMILETSKHGSETRVDRNLESAANYLRQTPKHKLDRGEDLYQDEHKMNWNAAKTSEKTSLDMETPWSDSEKSEPWWRISDKEELAFLVAQKSMELIENCDLPRPTQSVHVSGSPFSCSDSLEATRMFPGKKVDASVCNNQKSFQDDHTLGGLDGKNWSFGEGLMRINLDKFERSAFGMATKPDDTSQIDSRRAKLLEALRHSQTRARKAETAAQKAYDDKEHIIKLLFRQASHLFAYKQWLHMLQLESLCLQLRIKEQQISKLIQAPPWMPLKPKQTGKDKNHKAKQKKDARNFYRNAIAFAVGLGLAGAGLLLGWTLGWLFSAF